MKMRILLLASVITIFAACKKTKTEEQIPAVNTTGQISEQGFGPSNMPFAAASWQLPTGVQLEDSIHEYSYCWAFAPFTQVPPREWKGVPLGFSFCLTFTNTTSSTIIINFPPQLIYTSSSVLHQNILTIELGTVELPAGTTKTIVTQGFCLNLGRAIPETFEEGTGNILGYAFGPATIPAALQEIVDVVKSKHITMEDILKPDGTIDNDKAQKYAIIQAAIWEVTDRQGLTTDTKNQLLAL